MDTPHFSLVIPAYNESGRLRHTLQQCVAALDTHPPGWEIIVVDDGSTDDTRMVATEAAERDARIRVLAAPHGGKGAAVRRGMLEARGRLRFFADADLAVGLDQLPRFFEADADVVIGSREAPGARRIGEPVFRHLVGRAFNLIVRLIAVRGIRDTQCGYKLFSARAAELLFRLSRLDGFAFDVELLFLARRNGLTVREVPVTWHHRTGSRVRLQTGLMAFAQILQIRWNDLRGRYDRGMGSSPPANHSLPGWVMAVPPMLVAAFALLLGLGVPPVTRWFWPVSDTNIVEAAFVRDGARVRVLAARRESLNDAQRVRPELLDSDDPRVMTPLEAAIRGRSDEVVRLVLELGAKADADEATRLQCVALEEGADGAAALMGEAFGLAAPSCGH